jgi:thiol-disulfide isomerase/thioredoxin
MTMQQLHATAASKVGAIYQTIVLDDKGYILESSDTIFITHFLKKLPVTAWCPFLESMFPSLLQLHFNYTNNFDIFFSCIKNPSVFLYGFFDFYFVATHRNGAPVLHWYISDKTNIYVSARTLQQDRQEKIIATQQKYN